MARSNSSPAPEAQLSAYRVERPRASDAVAAALRDAYDWELGVPDDMIVLLHAINRAGPTSH